MAVDPICHMTVDEHAAIKAVKDQKEYYFCSTHCRDTFIKEQHSSPTGCCNKQTSFFKNKLFLVSSISILLVAASYFFVALSAFRVIFLTYLKSIWWAVLAGFILGGIIDYYVPQEYIVKVLAQRKPRSIVNAVLLGFLMSACSHGILALSIQLHKKGASNPAVVSFLLASPWANLTITILLVSLFGIKGLLIIAATLVVAINTGFIFLFLEKAGLIERNKNTIEVAEHFSITRDIKIRAKNYSFSRKTLFFDIQGILRGSRALSDMVLWWLLIGMLIASFAGAYIPSHVFHRFMGPTFLGLLVTLALATVIEVCSEGSSPLAFEIYRNTGALGNSFVFLMAGVATDYTEIGLLWTNVGRRTALWLPVVTVPQIIVLGYIFNLFMK
ncbi:MAG: permease [Candidatus Omnitrophota bacterium]